MTTKEKLFKFASEAAKRDFLGLPDEIVKQFGTDLRAIQQGKEPYSDFKDISRSVGAGAIELIENGSPAYRAIYCAKYLDTVYILHAFTKTTNGVDRHAMEVAKNRYKEMISEVEAEKKELSKKRRKGPKKRSR